MKTILRSFERKIDSNRMPLAHEGFARVASSILLLRAGDCFEGFLHSQGQGRPSDDLGGMAAFIQLRKSPRARDTAASCREATLASLEDRDLADRSLANSLPHC